MHEPKVPREWSQRNSTLVAEACKRPLTEQEAAAALRVLRNDDSEGEGEQ